MAERLDRSDRWRKRWVWVLAAVLAGQLAVLYFAGPPDPVGNGLGVGERLGQLPAADAHGATELETSTADGGWTLVMAFSSTCTHCLAAAPEWTRWLERRPDALPGLRTIAVTPEPWQVGRDFAVLNRWETDVLSLADSGVSSLGGWLISRTPWLFLFDETGALRHEGPGADFVRTEAVYRAARSDKHTD